MDPDNRLVAGSLEADWNAKLKMLAEGVANERGEYVWLDDLTAYLSSKP